MVLKRKIYKKLLEWKNDCQGKKALMVEGARRIGKSTICEEFGKNEYDSYIIVDFAKKDRELEEYFDRYLNDLDTFFLLLQTHFGVKLIPRKSLIIFDEVQMFPQARAAIKYLVADGRYDYLETGSLISIKENVKDIVIPSEERHINMYPLDFEEFASALGEELLVEYIKKCLFTNGPMIFALPVRNQDDKYFWKGNDIIGYHAITCTGFNDKGFSLLNSWGKSWANNGTTILPFTDYKNQIIESYGIII